MDFVPYLIGLDVGQVLDPAALAIAELQWVERPDYAAMQYDIRHLQRFELGTSYPDLVRQVKAICDALPLPRGRERAGFPHVRLRQWRLLVDATGVGRPVIDMMEEEGLLPVAVTMHHGHAVTKHAWNEWTVPKRDLVGALQVVLQNSRTRLAQGLPAAKLVLDEARNFQYKLTKNMNDQYGAWREGKHDDLLFATGLIAWYGETIYPPRYTLTQPQQTAKPTKIEWQRRGPQNGAYRAS